MFLSTPAEVTIAFLSDEVIKREAVYSFYVPQAKTFSVTFCSSSTGWSTTMALPFVFPVVFDGEDWTMSKRPERYERVFRIALMVGRLSSDRT